MTVEQIHDQGAKRHGAAWARANQRAVDAMGYAPLKPWDSGVKETIPRVILKILDGVRLDAGEEWLKDATEWTPRKQS